MADFRFDHCCLPMYFSCANPLLTRPRETRVTCAFDDIIAARPTTLCTELSFRSKPPSRTRLTTAGLK